MLYINYCPRIVQKHLYKVHISLYTDKKSYMTNGLSYMGKYLCISSYIRKPFLIYEFATAPLWNSCVWGKLIFFFISVKSVVMILFFLFHAIFWRQRRINIKQLLVLFSLLLNQLLMYHFSRFWLFCIPILLYISLIGFFSDLKQNLQPKAPKMGKSFNL